MAGEDRHWRLVVVGSGWRFTSGISYYTCHLANALSRRHQVSAVLMRNLLPKRLYPGAARVGRHAPQLAYAPLVRVVDGVDWWGHGLATAVRELVRTRPQAIVLQWWTGVVLHSYLVLALVGRILGARIVVEFHEVQDTGEARIPLVTTFTSLGIKPLLALASGFVVHSSRDRVLVSQAYGLADRPVAVIPHGPFDHHHPAPDATGRPTESGGPATLRVLYFGTVRPYKGVEDLIEAFGSLTPEQAEGLELAVVGEVWEGWVLPDRLIETSPYRSRIRRRSGYVPDVEVDWWFDWADALVLPYRRSSASGPLHIGMSWGLPVVVTAVGGLPEAAGDYRGALFVPPADVSALRAALLDLPAMATSNYRDPRSWSESVRSLEELLTELGLPPG